MWTRLLTIGLLLMISCDAIHGQDFGRRSRRDRRDSLDRGDRRGFGGPQGGFDPIGRIDANQNGRIDQEEIDRIPKRFREMMKARGFQLNAGESVDDVRERTRRRFEEERRRREQEGDSGDSSSGRDNRSTPPPIFKPRERERMTLDLPNDYVEVDSDLDGQIGLYEWIVVRRDELELFDSMDRDSDGLLTPRELAAWQKANEQAAQETGNATKRQKLLIVGSETTPTSGRKSTRSDDSRRSRSERGDDRDRERSFGWSSFRRRDRDRD